MTRQEAIKVLDSYHGRFLGHSDKQVYEALMIAIESLKTDEEAEHAKWMRFGSRTNVNETLYWFCSECGSLSSEIHADKLFEYCPHCGAKMDGGQK